MKYRTIVADPPWDYPGGFNGFGTRRTLPYPSMSVDEIRELPVADLLERRGYVFCWATQRYLHEALHVVEAWGCAYKQTLTWAKAPMGSGLGGMFSSTTEFVIVAQHIRAGTHAHHAHRQYTKPGRVPTTWFEWKRPKDGAGKPLHSAKPDGLMDLVESVCEGPYLELFARRQRLGWDTWGNECRCDVEMVVNRQPNTRETT